jgi:hypothetical protein
MDAPVLRAPVVVMRACKQQFKILPDCLGSESGVYSGAHKV